MDKLPVEIIEKILSYKSIHIRDVVNFSTTSKHFRETVMCSSSIWKEKYYDRWPQFVKLFDKCYSEYLDEIQYIYDLQKRTYALLETMPPRFYKYYQLSDIDFKEWTELLTEKERTYYYIVQTLTKIVSCNESIKSIELVPLKTPGNKTLQYYASKVLRFVKQQHLTKVWQNYLSLPAKKQTLERGATFVAQWCQTDLDITDEKVEDHLDDIASFVKQRLADINPNHPLLVAPQEDLDRWRSENLDKNQWNVSECRQIIVAMREVMYSDLGFHGNSENYYMPENSLINEVLERRTGLPIILAVIYESIGRRLGLLFEPINFPAHFLLRFIIDEEKKPVVYYIDTFNGGDVMQKTACPYSTSVSREVLFPVATSVQVVERIVNNLELSTRQHIELNGRVSFLRAVLELLILVSPHDLSAVVSLAKLYTLHRIDTRSLEDYLASQILNAPDEVEGILTMIQSLANHNIDSVLEFGRDIPAVPRTNDLKYAIGMIVVDISNNDKCVIYGWNAPPQGPTAESFPNYPKSGKPTEPFYNVLMEDGSHRCIPQSLLTPSSEVGYLNYNKDLGRHFSHFFENHFVPNAEKESEYPFDKKVRQKFYHETQLKLYKP